MEPDEYRKMAGVEDRMWYYRALHRHVRRSLQARDASVSLDVLDAGCGTGGLLRYLKGSFPKWRFAGLDFSPLACGLARERTGVDVAEGSIAAMPFADGTFDVVTSCDVVCQVREASLALREIHRCLKPGGTVVLTMPAYQWMYSYHDREVANLRRYTCDEMNAAVKEAGFVSARSTYWNTLPFPLVVIRRKIFPPASPASDVRLYPPLVESAFNGLMAIEHGWLRSGGRMPFGNSVLTVAQKPAQD